MFWSKEKRMKIKLFNKIWWTCAHRGDCDSFGGFEYRQIKRIWIRENYPEPIDEFIRKHAN